MYSTPLWDDVASMDGYFYSRWSDQGQRGQTSPPLFDNVWLDGLFMVPWYLPLIYGWVVTTLFSGWMAWFFGFFLWQPTEYLVHRFVFHGLTPYYTNPWVRCFHMLLHGRHHRFPDDNLRQIQPPIIAIPCGMMLYSVLPSGIFSGFVSGYILYEVIHYCLHTIQAHPNHLWPFCTILWQEMCAHHTAHHRYRPGPKASIVPGTHQNFGVTTSFGDVLGGTQHS